MISRHRRLAVALVLTSAVMSSSSLRSQAPVEERTRPLKSLDLSAIDTSIDACTDFYQYACGGWRKSNPVPGDKARWGRFDELREFNLYTLRDILEGAAEPSTGRTPIEAQVGDFYAACMDTTAIDAAGLRPIAPDLERIASAASQEDLIRVMGALRRDGVSTLFTLGVGPDLKDSTKTLMNVDQGGISLPDRDYYLKDDPKSADTREKYLTHVGRMFGLAGDTEEQAAARAKQMLALETRLAAAQLDRVARRNPNNRDHRMTLDALKGLTPGFDLAAYTASAEAPAFADVNVGWPDFFKALDVTWRETSAGGAQELRPLASTQRGRADARVAVRARELRFLQPVPARHQGTAAAVEDVRGRRRRWSRGSARPALRTEGVRRRQQGPHDRARERPHGGARRRHHDARLDDARDEDTGDREAQEARQAEDRVPRHVARLLVGARGPRRLPREQPPRRPLRGEAQLRQARQARGPDRVGDDAADGERLLLVPARRDCLSRRASCSRRSSTGRRTMR